MKKKLIGLSLLSLSMLASCDLLETSQTNTTGNNSVISSSESDPTTAESSSSVGTTKETPSTTEETPSTPKETTTDETPIAVDKSVYGYGIDKTSDFTQYYGTDAYVTVTNAEELLYALKDAREDYTTTWDAEKNNYTQELHSEGKVKVIEIANDIELGYNKISDEAKKETNLVGNFSQKKSTYDKNGIQASDMLNEYGISQIAIENTSNLLIYSKNGAKLRHGGFKVNSCYDIVFRNLDMDELWQWEDANTVKPNVKIGDYDCYGWAYFKINFSSAIWIDHCSFGKSYDGQIDIANPVYWTEGTAFRAPYNAENKHGVSITNCDFHAGSDDKDGYIYKMMEKIEQNYQEKGEASDYQFYRTLRDTYGLTFEQILYGVAIPQKKGFLIGDGTNEADTAINHNIYVTFANCRFTNLQDRLPKLRGGFVYMYNCVVDSTQFYEYKKVYKEKNVADIKNLYFKKFKCGTTSQGLIAAYGGAIRCENCIFLGIEDLAKNNEKEDSTLGGGISLVDCLYSKDGVAATTLINTDTNKDSLVLGSGLISVDKFNWHNEDNKNPFVVTLIDVNALVDTLSNVYNIGANQITE